MSARDDGGPAFPSHGSMGEVAHQGMTLRDYFAAQALQGYLASWPVDARIDEVRLVARCYDLADAMLEARRK